jgi:asparagine synthase (glutamine-hydrolysing)
MCGIAALFCDSPRPEVSGWLLAMMRAVRHRGPDGQGAIAGAGLSLQDDHQPADWALGHVRLAILDLSAAGLQPMGTPDRKLWISYNGEVYNYLELADELRRAGHSFRSGTDTEVILAAYRQWGPDCVARFRGMFAMVIIDLSSATVFAARDRLGIKPLSVWCGDRLTAIVSELKQLYALPGFAPRLNRQQAVDYLSEGLLGHEADQTLLQDVVPLEPSCWLTWKLGQSPQLAQRQVYWRPARATQPRAWDEAVSATGQTFRAAVELRLRSDVPVGTCLSGGIDSSSIVAVATRDYQARMKTFSVCHDDPRISEERYIDEVARYCGADSIKLRLRQDDALADLDDFLYHQDEPVFSLSQYGEFAVMRLARQHGVPVLLNGQGGDEALCGYRKYAYFFLQQLWRQRRFATAARHVTATLIHGDRQLFQFWQGVRYVPSWLRRRYDPMGEILRPEVVSGRRGAWRSRMQGVQNLHEHQWADLRWWSLPVLLRYQDRNSMAHSIEARVPLVDHEFLELMLTMPEEYFFRRGMTKRLLVDALGDRLPDSLRSRRTKLGFDTPQATWLKGRLGEELEQRLLRCDRIDSLVDRRAASGAFSEYRQGSKRIPHFVLFRLACLAVWLERFAVAPN